MGNFIQNVKATPGASQCSNGIVDCYDTVPRKFVNKLMLDEYNKYPIDVIDAWAASAKITLSTVSHKIWLTNHQLYSTYSHLALKHLNVIHEINTSFIEAESNDKLQRPWKSKTGITTAFMYDLGDFLYYIRNYSDMWKEPDKVTGKENKHILVTLHPSNKQNTNNTNLNKRQSE